MLTFMLFLCLPDIYIERKSAYTLTVFGLTDFFQNRVHT